MTAPNVQLALTDPMLATFEALVRERGLQHSAADHWPTETTRMPELGEPLGSADRGVVGRQALFGRPEGVLRLILSGGVLRVVGAARSAAEAEGLVAAARAAVPRDVPDPGRVPVDFWVDAVGGPTSTSRRLQMPDWAAIEGNYPAATGAALEALAVLAEPPAPGRLVLLHGPPGTGKTTALRALAREWRPWALMRYVSDPDAFLMDPAYMQAVLLAGDPTDRCGLVVLEDVGDLLTAQGHMRDGLGRLLNLTDGLLGQGLKVLVLATSNLPPNKLDPALIRPGRCAAEIAFEPFDLEEGRDWLSEHDGDPSAVTGECTLADLYAHLDGRTPATPPRRPVGFVTA